VTNPAPIAVALDAPNLEIASRWAGLVTPHVSTVKIGLELYLRYGPEVVASIRGASGVRIFLDLKLHDIPATVASAVRAVARLRPQLITVHAAGGPAMIRAAVEAAPGTPIAAVTALTSLNGEDLDRIGVPGGIADWVLRLAAMAVEAGASAGGAPGRRRQARPGAGGHARGGAQGRGGPAGHRPRHHRCARPRRRGRGHRRIPAPPRAGRPLNHPLRS
jgi:orotidine-5'-phosphate decarboxylase